MPAPWVEVGDALQFGKFTTTPNSRSLEKASIAIANAILVLSAPISDAAALKLMPLGQEPVSVELFITKLKLPSAPNATTFERVPQYQMLAAFAVGATRPSSATAKVAPRRCASADRDLACINDSSPAVVSPSNQNIETRVAIYSLMSLETPSLLFGNYLITV